jgi:hypothetical protein
VQKFAQSTEGIFYYDLSCVYAFSALMICVAKVNRFLSSTPENSHIMP